MADALSLPSDTIVADGDEPLKSLADAAAGTMRVGAYAVRFADGSEPDLTGEYFTANTDFGPTMGDGAATMFNHGICPAKGLEAVCEQTFGPVKVTRDDTGLFVETCLDLSDKYQAAIGKLVAQGKLKWSSGTAKHVERKSDAGEIKRWHPVEFSFTPTPAEPRLPAIRPLKSVELDADAVEQLAAALAVDKPAPAVPEPSPTKTHATVTMTEAEKAAALSDATKLRLDEINQITAIGTHFKCVDAASDFIAQGKSVDDFRKHVLEEVKKAPQVLVTGNLGMDRREIKSYSLLKAVREMASEKGLTGLEKEASEATAKLTGRPVKGFLLPQDVAEVSLAEAHDLGSNAIKALASIAAKNLNQTTFSQGGALVGTNLLTGSMIELLRNKPLIAQMGAMTMTGLVGDVAIPRIQGGATAYWLSENAPVPESDQIFGQLGLKPKRLVADTAWTKELANQTDLSVEALVRNDLTTVLALAKDVAAINGPGGAAPLGILNTTGTSPVTFGGTASRVKAIAFQKAVAVANASRGSLAYLTTPSTAASWLATPEATNYPKFLLEGNIDMGTVVGRPAYSTNQVPGDLVIYGNFNDLILADWAGIDVVVDPYTLKKQGMIEITVTLWCDVGVRHAVSFAVSTDSGAQ